MLKIATAAYPPYTFDCSLQNLKPRDDCPFPGIDAEILAYVLDFMDISYTLIPFEGENVLWGDYRNHKWNGFLQMVQKGIIDTISCGYNQIIIRNNFFSFPYPIDTVMPQLIAHEKDPTFFEKSLQVFRVFSLEVWLWTLVTCVILVLSLLVLVRLTPRKAPNKWSNCKIIWEGFRLFVVQGSDRFRHRSWATNSLLIWINFGALLMLSLYQGCLLTRMLHPIRIKLFADGYEATDLIKAGSLKLIMPGHGYWYAQEIESNPSYFYRKLKDALVYNPYVMVPNFNESLDMVSSGNYILPSNEATADFTLRERCNLSVVTTKDLPSMARSFIFAKDSPFVRNFSLSLLSVQDYTRFVISKYRKKYRSACTEIQHSRTLKAIIGGKKLNWGSMSGVFVLLWIGSSLGLCTFVSELYRRYKLRKEGEEDDVSTVGYESSHSLGNFSNPEEPVWSTAIAFTGCAIGRHESCLSQDERRLSD